MDKRRGTGAVSKILRLFVAAFLFQFHINRIPVNFKLQPSAIDGKDPGGGINAGTSQLPSQSARISLICASW
jgi:hypothetical protein